VLKTWLKTRGAKKAKKELEEKLAHMSDRERAIFHNNMMKNDPCITCGGSYIKSMTYHGDLPWCLDCHSPAYIKQLNTEPEVRK